MKKYIIAVDGNQFFFTAASKAREDAETIARKCGYERFPFIGERTANRNPLAAVPLIIAALRNWHHLARAAEPGSTVLLQYPHYPLKTAVLMRRIIPVIRKRKGIRFVFLVHDLNSLRGTFGRAAVYSDRHLLREADAVICHNEKMKEYLVAQGIPAEKLIPLEIFDYLTEAQPREHRLQDGIAVAGNLDPAKCGYIGKLVQAGERKLPLHLYGKGFPEELQEEGVFPHGAFPAEELPGMLEGGFGLVWDGPEITSCTGKMGEYLRYNNPHKLSLYFASGLPVIIWKEAAEAGFVEENGVGLAVDSLKEAETLIGEITEDAYREMARGAKETGEALRKGARLEAALRKTEA